jgi:hypothetical protein
MSEFDPSAFIAGQRANRASASAKEKRKTDREDLKAESLQQQVAEVDRATLEIIKKRTRAVHALGMHVVGALVDRAEAAEVVTFKPYVPRARILKRDIGTKTRAQFYDRGWILRHTPATNGIERRDHWSEFLKHTPQGDHGVALMSNGNIVRYDGTAPELIPPIVRDPDHEVHRYNAHNVVPLQTLDLSAPLAYQEIMRIEKGHPISYPLYSEARDELSVYSVICGINRDHVIGLQILDAMATDISQLADRKNV